jgi:hypothetical protein
MQTIEKRIAALEAANQDDSLKIIVAEDGQTEAEALRLAGLPPDARGVIYCSPLDAML